MSFDFKNNEVLAKQLRKGNKDAFAFLFELYYENLCKYVFSFTKNKKLAEDICQNAMMDLWKNRSTIESQKSVKAYLYKIAYHNFVNEFRKSKERNDFLNEVKSDTLVSWIEENDGNLKKKEALILEEIQKLPPKCKEVFLLSKKHGLKYREIAEELNISIKTVEIHISKAMRILRDKLNDMKKP